MSQDTDDDLTRYLLGDLPVAEAERLDELSITDDAIALRLRVLEDELIDRYARGERSGGPLEQFTRVHRESPYLQEKLRFAEALQARAASTDTSAMRRRAVLPRPLLIWSLGTAAALLLAAAGYLFLANQRLHSDFYRLDALRASIEQQNAQLRQQLDRHTEAAPPSSPILATFLLPPPRRGLSDETAIAVPRRAEHVVLRLQVEVAGYARFWTALRDVENDRIVWRSADLSSEATGADRIVSLTVPVSALRTQRYAIELSGVGARGAAELVAEYSVRVVLE